MKLPRQLNLQQRYNLSIFFVITLLSIVLVVLMASAIDNYTGEYTRHYWQGHTKTFAASTRFQLTLGAASGAGEIAKNFTSDRNVLKAAIYSDQDGLLASAGDNLECKAKTAGFSNPLVIEANTYWCFYEPVYQENHYLGHVELVVSKAELRAVLHGLFFVSLLIILIFLIVLMLVVSRLSRLFTTTLVDMSFVLKKVAQGERGARVSFSGALDIDMIHDVINDMLSKVEATEQELEQRVDDRTKELEIALEGSQAANVYKNQIMTTITHEMKTPLHAISLFLQTLLKLPEGADPDLLRELNITALARANEMKENIESFLLKSRLGAEQYDLSYATVDIKPLMQRCKDKVSFLQRRNRNQLTLSGEDLSVTCDEEVLSHIVNNLLSNACKFTQDGDIKLDWKLVRDDLVIQVCDTGCGISIENRSRVFDAFWQEDMGLSRKYGGHGLGLSIVQQFVQRLGGSIGIEPNAGKGTIITVRIPISAEVPVHLP